MLPIVLITGFLGSGKTTLLRALTKSDGSRRLACIVNEFGPVDVDGELLDLPPGELVSIPGGSIFCRCLVGEFIRVLRTLSGGVQPRRSLPPDDRTSSGVQPRRSVPHQPAPETVTTQSPANDVVVPDRVLIEASGIADPKVVAEMLAETGLDQVYELRRIVSVVDPGSFMALIHTLPNIIAQIEASDLVLINKTDLYGAEQVAATEDKVRQINPQAVCVRTQFARLDVDLFEPVAPRAELKGNYAPCRDPNYITRTVNFSKPVDREELLSALRALQPHVYRAKGFVPTQAGTLYVDVSAAKVSCQSATAKQEVGSTIVVIAAPEAREHLEVFAKRVQPDQTSLRISQ